MNRVSYYRIAGTLTILACVCAPLSQGVTINFPPPGSNVFIQAGEFDSGLSVCPELQCTIISSTTAPLELPTTTYSNTVNTGTVSGSITASTMHSFVSSNRPGIELDLALNDSYTVHGATSGTFPITVTFGALGTADAGGVTNTLDILLGSVSVKIGTLDINPAAATIPTVDALVSKNQDISGPASATGYSIAVDDAVSLTENVSVGQTFDLAFELSSLIVIGDIDLSHTATISFDTPDGVYLTSALGGTFGDVPTPPTGAVPEPAMMLPLGLGFAGLLFARRKAKAR
jgi:hypothetical protein